MELIGDPWFWALGLAAVFLTGISKGGLGGGAGSVSTPLLSLVVSPFTAAAVMLPVLCVMDVFGIRAYLWKWDGALVRRIVTGGVLGCVAGAATFSVMSENWIRILLGAIALGFLVITYLPRRRLPAAPSLRAGFLWTVLSGYTSFVTHAGGPPALIYLLGLRLEKTVFIATCLVYFAALNYAKILPYVYLGLFDARILATAAALLPAGIAGIYFGIWLQKRMSARLFYRIVHVLLFLSGAKLLYDGLAQL
jgi:uncharacterized membrane protein YfcA